MSAELLAAIAPFLDRLQRTVQTDPKLRSEVSALGKALVSWCEPAAEPKPPPVHVPTPIIPLAPLAPIAPLPPAPSYGRKYEEPAPPPAPIAIAIPPSPPIHHGHDEHSGWMPQEPSIIAGRCRAKGEACKWVAKRNAGSIEMR